MIFYNSKIQILAIQNLSKTENPSAIYFIFMILILVVQDLIRDCKSNSYIQYAISEERIEKKIYEKIYLESLKAQ